MHAGIDVAAPVALVEQRCGPFVSAAWFVSAYVEGDDLLSCWEKREPTPHELAAIASLFQGLANSRILHGDMKASNLISAGEKVFLIDFDGAKIASNQAMLARDKHRFLRNWDNPPLIQSLSGILAL
jgi:tRNA A-37 threonylcarbamoyl transferase component Bud32